jgi:hypothetical protein
MSAEDSGDGEWTIFADVKFPLILPMQRLSAKPGTMRAISEFDTEMCYGSLVSRTCPNGRFARPFSRQ